MGKAQRLGRELIYGVICQPRKALICILWRLLELQE